MPAEHVPRPKNAFIFFRSYYNAHPLEFVDPSDQPHPDQNSVSCAAAAIWRSYSLEEKRPFQEMAEREKERYQVEYPGYKYGSGGGGVKRVKDRRRSLPNTGTTKKVTKAKRRQSVSRRRVSIASTTTARSPSPLPPSLEAMSPQSSTSPTPPPRTPSPMLEEAPDYHSDYVIGAEFDFDSDAYLDDELDIKFSHYSFNSVEHVKEEWDTYVDPVFPSYREDPASFYAHTQADEGGGEFTFFHQGERVVKVEEQDEEEQQQLEEVL